MGHIRCVCFKNGTLGLKRAHGQVMPPPENHNNMSVLSSTSRDILLTKSTNNPRGGPGSGIF